MRVLFFVHLPNRTLDQLQFIGFYKNDIDILRELGHDVIIINSFSELIKSRVTKFDLFYSWWWGYSSFVALLAYVLKTPIIITGAFDYDQGDLRRNTYVGRPFYEKFLYRLSLRLASANLFISKYEFNQVVSALKVNNPVYCPLSVNTVKYHPSKKDRSNYFVICTTTTRENIKRKNLFNVLSAFKNFRAQYPNYKLAIFGSIGDGHKDLEHHIEQLNLSSFIELRGLIPEDEKISLFQTCTGYLQPSFYEGFGLGLLEAVSCGSTVVVSSNGSIPEVAGPFAIYVDDPSDINKLSQAMMKALAEENNSDLQYDWVCRTYSSGSRKSLLKSIIISITEDVDKAANSD